MFGKNEYNFVPMTFVLPADYGLLKTEVDSKNNTKWILKPVSNKKKKVFTPISIIRTN